MSPRSLRCTRFASTAAQRSPRLASWALATACALSLAGCSTTMNTPSLSSLTSWIPSIPPPSFDWLFGKSNKPGPLPELKGEVTPQLRWQASMPKASAGFAPAVTDGSVFVAAPDGTVARIDGTSGKTAWSVNVGRKLSAGPGADGKTVVVGTDKAEVIALDEAGKERWTAHVSSEVVAPPQVTDTVVLVFSNDGRIYGLAPADGKTKWVYQRTNPPLIVRNTAGGVVRRGALFIGTSGGHLLAIDSDNGTVGWDVTVSVPKGATELERIADVTSLPLVDDKTACAAAYQGHVACFEIVRGNIIWSRDLSSLAGLTADDRNVYLTDDRGNVHALDRSNGASVWKQDVLAQRRVGGPQIIGPYVGVVDVEGYLHLLSRDDGRYVGRLATDGSAPTAQPARLGDGIVWQSDRGGVFAVGAK